jgi:hypothetical protein
VNTVAVEGPGLGLSGELLRELDLDRDYQPRH